MGITTNARVRSGGLNRDVKICVQLIVVNPLYNKKTVGFQTVHDLESFGKNNAVSGG